MIPSFMTEMEPTALRFPCHGRGSKAAELVITLRRIGAAVFLRIDSTVPERSDFYLEGRITADLIRELLNSDRDTTEDP